MSALPAYPIASYTIRLNGYGHPVVYRVAADGRLVAVGPAG